MPAAAPEQPSVVSRRRVARRAREPEKKKSRAPLAAAVLLLLLLIAVAGAGYWKLTRVPAAVVVDPSAAQTEELKIAFQEGKNLIRQGKWVEAGAKFQQVLAARPDFAEGTVKSYLAAAEREIPNQHHFEAAAAALARNELGNAHRALAAVSADTQQMSRRDQLQAQQVELFKARIAEGQALAQAGGEAKLKKLKALAEDLLVARPEDRDALEFKSIADRALRVRAEVKVELPKDDPGLEVIRKYASGDAGAAFTAAAACAAQTESCRRLEATMTELNGLLKRLEALQPAELEGALRLDRQLAGMAGKVGSSPQGKPITTRIAAVFYRKASAAKTVGDWGQAMSNAFKVADAEPGHAAALAMLNEGRERARELFLRCYTQRQTDPEQAMPLCTEVVSMLPPGDSQREKAEKVLQQLRAK